MPTPQPIQSANGTSRTPARGSGNDHVSDACPPLGPHDRVARSGPLAGIRYGNELTAAARKYGVDPTLLAGVAAQESGGPGALCGNAHARQPDGEGRGLMQIDGGTWRFARTAAAFDPNHSANFAASILASNLHTTHGDVHGALNLYNSGNAHHEGARTTWPDGAKLPYASSVERHVQDIRAYEAARER